MDNITIIIPIADVNSDNESLISKAVESAVKTGKGTSPVMIVGPKEVTDKYKDDKDITVVVNKGETDFCSQVNLGVKKCTTEFFSVLELDDVYKENWFENVEKYLKSQADTSAFLPLVETIEFGKEDNGPLGYINEAVWASSFSDVIGYLDMEAINHYPNFNVTGAVIKKEDFEEVGGLKPSIKISFWYEFLLRFVNNEKKAFVIPKVGYFHFFNRPGSLTEEYHKTISEDEANWWISLAQQEYFFKKDRKKTYEE